jgi:hypothetical protein
MKRLLLFAFIIATVTACVSYKKVSLGDAPARDQQLRENFSGYDIYVYDGQRTYAVRNPKLEGEDVSGQLDDISSTEKADLIKQDKLKGSSKDNKHAVVLHTNKSIDLIKDSLSKVDDAAISSKLAQPNGIILTASDIRTVNGYALDEGDLGASILIGLLVLLGAVIVIWGTIMVSNAVGGSANSDSGSQSGSQSGSTQQGGSSDGNSFDNSSDWSSDASGSNTSSDASNSSDSGSCYVATMVYGSYDAPEVLVLRKFRDQVLQKSSFGRGFIRFYYQHSPKFVARTKHLKLVNDCIRFHLSIFVKMLKKILR